MNRWQPWVNAWHQQIPQLNSLPRIGGKFCFLIMGVAIASYLTSGWLNLLFIIGVGLMATVGLILQLNPAPPKSPSLETSLPLDRQTLEKMAGITGLEYLQFTCVTLGKLFSNSRVWLASVQAPSIQQMETLVVSHQEQIHQNFAYSLPGTPCELLKTQHQVYYPNNLSGLFPHATYLEKFPAQSYWGVQILDSQHQFVGVLVIVNDQPMNLAPAPEILAILLPRISQELERYQAFEKLKNLKDIALVESAHNSAANFAKSQFLANLSHELRTPLNVILGFTKIIARDQSLSLTNQENLRIIIQSGEHLLALINEVLEISKIEAGKIMINESSFDFYQFLDSLAEMMKIKADEKGIYLIFNKQENLPKYIRADAGKLRQILINLLGNAIKFTPEGGVSLRVEYQTHQLIFEVEDTGLGMSPEELQSLFEMFVQATGGQISGEGTGLGLPISRQLIELMNGEMTVESSVGHGSLFRFTLPISLAEPDKLDQPSIYQQVVGLVPHQPSYRILVVDDHLPECQLLMQLLTSVGFDVKIAENGQVALSIWQQWHPHLIWMDLQMPVMDGYQTTRLIKMKEKQWGNQTEISPKSGTIIIALTATAFVEEKSAILAAGCDDWVLKPFQEQIIFEKIAKHLNVEYIYENTDNFQRIETDNFSLETLISQLQKMPISWVNNLERAAIELDDQWLLKLLEEIPKEHENLAQVLKSWVDNFQLDQVTQLIEYGFPSNP